MLKEVLRHYFTSFFLELIIRGYFLDKRYVRVWFLIKQDLTLARLDTLLREVRILPAIVIFVLVKLYLLSCPDDLLLLIWYILAN